MSTQTVKKYYCTQCETTGEYPNSIAITINACADANEIITPDVYNEIYDSLKSIRDFGDYDDTTRKPNINNLIKKEVGNIINTDFYNSIANEIKNGSSHSSGDIIYGTYLVDLQTITQTYKVPNTRYYKTTTDCCGCYGECGCYGQCGACYGHYQCTGCEGDYGPSVCQGAVGSCT